MQAAPALPRQPSETLYDDRAELGTPVRRVNEKEHYASWRIPGERNNWITTSEKPASTAVTAVRGKRCWWACSWRRTRRSPKPTPSLPRRGGHGRGGPLLACSGGMGLPEQIDIIADGSLAVMGNGVTPEDGVTRVKKLARGLREGLNIFLAHYRKYRGKSFVRQDKGLFCSRTLTRTRRSTRRACSPSWCPSPKTKPATNQAPPLA